MSAKIVELVGTEGLSTLSSYNIEEDFIPDRVRQLFDDDPNKYFQVYFLNEQSQIMVKNQWLFQGRDLTYTEYAYAELGGTCTRVVVTFQGRTSFHENFSGYGNMDISAGEQIQLKVPGRHIP